jgi:DNA-binding response OmpR family regulator
MAERVLMIEDDQSLAAMVGEYLGALGIKVTARATAADGLKLWRHGGFDALILRELGPYR